jgi:hypothetical protein
MVNGFSSDIKILHILFFIFNITHIYMEFSDDEETPIERVEMVDDSVKKPKRVMSDEHKLKLKEKRDAKKLEKEEAKVAEKIAKPKRVMSETQKANLQKGRDSMHVKKKEKQLASLETKVKAVKSKLKIPDTEPGPIKTQPKPVPKPKPKPVPKPEPEPKPVARRRFRIV